jgi:pyrophosphatase PpaX
LIVIDKRFYHFSIEFELLRDFLESYCIIPIMAEIMRAVLWDLDGTAHDTHELIISSCEYSLKQNGHSEISRAEISRLLGMTLTDFYKKIAPNADQTALVNSHVEFQKENTHLIVPFPNTITTISELRKNGFKNAAVTSRSKGSALENLEITKVGPLIDFVVAKGDVKKPKPDPEGIFVALDYLQVLSQNAWMIGDSHVDIEAGKAAGTKTIGFTNNKQNVELYNCNADYLVDEISQVLPIILAEINLLNEGKIDTNQRLTVEDSKNPMFDKQKVVLRTIGANKNIRQQIISDMARDMTHDMGSDDFGTDGIDPIMLDVAEDFIDAEEDSLPREKSVRVIEGSTYTDGFNLVGFTYSLEDSSITIKNTKNEVLFKGKIFTAEEYEKALKKADKKQSKLRDKFD